MIRNRIRKKFISDPQQLYKFTFTLASIANLFFVQVLPAGCAGGQSVRVRVHAAGPRVRAGGGAGEGALLLQDRCQARGRNHI